LDITGCATCCHGEDQLLQRAVRELTRQEWIARIAIADTLGGAWAVAHFGSTPCAVPIGGMEEVLSALPVAALRLPAESLGLLANLGIERIAQLKVLPRFGLTSRFGPSLLQRLDQALGRLPEVITPCCFVSLVQGVHYFEPPTDHLGILHHALAELTERIASDLQTRHWAARQLQCQLHYETALPHRFEVNLYRPANSVQHLWMLLRTQLEQVQTVEPVCAVRLQVARTEGLRDHQPELFDVESAQNLQELSGLIDRLSAHLGQDAVTRASLLPDNQPEYACLFEPLVQIPKSRKVKESNLRLLLRPLQLWPKPISIQAISVIPEGPPIRFHWEKIDYRVIRCWGPERIETGWWRNQDVQRDYYVVMTHRGSRFWLFRRQDDGRWFLHGCFD
jgi:protein ImuB